MTDANPKLTAAPQETIDLRGGIGSRSFLCLVATQFLTAFNDNMFRWLAVAVAGHLLGPGHAQTALSLGGFFFTLPYLLLATPAGFFADRFSKRKVIVACKFAEVLVMIFGLLAIQSQNVPLLLGAVLFTGALSALFGPAKFGSVPELLRTDRLSLGNGILGLATVSAAAIGAIGGYWLYGQTKPDGIQNFWIPCTAILVTGVLGWLTSLGIRPLTSAQLGLKFPKNVVADTWGQLQLLKSNRSLMRTALGIMFFWSLAALVQMNIAVYGEGLQLSAGSETVVGVLMALLVLGVGCGSVLAGIWSGGRVELGIVPLGAFGVVVCSLALFIPPSISAETGTAGAAFLNAPIWSCFWLFGLGASAGLFNVPLDAFLQHRSPDAVRGKILAASNFLTFSGVLVSSGLFYVLQSVLKLSPTQTFLLTGLFSLPVLFYVLLLLPQATIRFVIWLLSNTVYRVRVKGLENIPEHGGALLVANHVTWVDAILLLRTSSRPIRMLAYADYVSGWGRIIKWLADTMGVIPVKSNDGPKALLRSLETAKQAIKDGSLVCIFAEGSLTRTGQLQPFQRGLLRIVDGTGAPVIPVYLDGLWGSIFSYAGGKFFWKRPRQWPYPVGILFGQPIAEPDNVHEVRQAVQNLGVTAVDLRKSKELTLPRQFLRRCRSSFNRPKLADSSRTDLKGRDVLLRTLVLRRLLGRLLAPDEKMVGVLLPPSVGGALVNAALPLMKRVPVNLNYTMSSETINACIAQCGIKHVLTSRTFCEKMGFSLTAEMVYLEDFKDKPTAMDKAIAAIQTFATPMWLLERELGLTRVSADDLLTVVFTSGSTGEPKGVMLSHHNVRSNIDAIQQLFQLTKNDCLLGILPFFHSFGFTGTMWTVLALEPKGVYHYNPLDARVIGNLSADHKATIIMTTPTFLRTYLRRCEKEQFAHMSLVVVGAEKMPVDLAQAFEEKFGVRPIEGYGTTELAPLAAVNVPDHRSAGETQKGTREGSVGRPVPGVSAKVIDPDTGAELGIDKPGMLLITGGNVMQGYMHKPELTAQVVRDGWYVTGDIAKIDSDGFITITDRLSRFSKIGGEMVPHIKVEEELTKILADESVDHEVLAVVTAIADEKKGERLVVLHKPVKKGVEAVWQQLSASGLPNLWVPARDSFVEVDRIPVLGTGKLDLRALKIVAQEKLGVRK